MINDVYLKFGVSKLQLMRNDDIKIPINNNVVYCLFAFGNDWQNIKSYARFYKNDILILEQEIVNNKCRIPEELMKHRGYFEIRVAKDALNITNVEKIYVSDNNEYYNHDNGIDNDFDYIKTTIDGKIYWIRENPITFLPEYSTDPDGQIWSQFVVINNIPIMNDVYEIPKEINSLEQIGLTEDDMSTIDFRGNVNNIINRIFELQENINDIVFKIVAKTKINNSINTYLDTLSSNTWIMTINSEKNGFSSIWLYNNIVTSTDTPVVYLVFFNNGVFSLPKLL